MTIKPGTLCVIVGCRYEPNLAVVGRVCEFLRYRDSGECVVRIPGTVTWKKKDIWYALEQHLRPISDPDADVSEWTGGRHPVEVAA